MNLKKTFGITLLLAVTALFVSAEPVDSIVAKQVAVNFYKSMKAPCHSSQCVYSLQKSLGEADSLTCFYVFNVGKGFVMVSGDDKIEPVLGYSLDETFNLMDVPDNMLFFMNSYADEIEAILRSPFTDNKSTKEKWDALREDRYAAHREGTVGPLIATKWGQTDFYNELCPADSMGPGGHAYTGCGAVVMGQMMKYWQYPTHGVGNHTYNCNFYGNYGELSADFEHTTYDYSQMPIELTYQSPAAEREAVATLLYHCGVAVNMRYGPNYSSVSAGNLVNAMSNYFTYPATIHYHERAYYSGDWIATIKSELDSFAPIFYGGAGNMGAHIFICDGYQSDDYFHMNWGWSGLYNNSYYMLSELNPGPYDYNSSHSMTVGIRGPELHNSLAEKETIPFHIYPNPVHQTLYVDLSSGQTDAYCVKIWDVMGRNIYTKNMENTHQSISVEGLPKGIYILQVEGKRQCASQKFVVE